MKLQFLGTAAAEGIPGIFCQCAVCQEARRKGGRFIRTRSQALIDDRLLIDLNADTYLHTLRYGIELSRIASVLITHAHSDHLYPAEIGMRKTGFAMFDEKSAPVLTVYGSDKVGEKIESVLQTPKINTVFREVRPFETFEVEGYTVTALPARHDPKAGPLFYLIEKDGKSILYGHDTGFYFDEVWDWFREKGKRLSLVSMDCTEGDKQIGYDSHGNVERDVAMQKKMLDEKIADENTLFVMNHFSHNGGKVAYDTFVPIAAGHGFLVSYDGMEIEL